ncbi:hypothetical protein EXN66_Car015286 [Channa argus]|uniref:Uncharacterized protein n=1 Tax=Channa argus TaxID=215402 RepID=A0A6G1QB11_CHAAH|nr:hypothetical protein EXN66_Car015286 [Channa argus]
MLIFSVPTRASNDYDNEEDDDYVNVDQLERKELKVAGRYQGDKNTERPEQSTTKRQSNNGKMQGRRKTQTLNYRLNYRSSS